FYDYKYDFEIARYFLDGGKMNITEENENVNIFLAALCENRKTDLKIFKYFIEKYKIDISVEKGKKYIQLLSPHSIQTLSDYYTYEDIKNLIEKSLYIINNANISYQDLNNTPHPVVALECIEHIKSVEDKDAFVHIYIKYSLKEQR